jgi:broad specificity phosphatase PhoE
VQLASTERPTRFIFVRHGQTEWNRIVRFRGRADIGLNRRGLWQAKRVALRLRKARVAAIYASPLSRTMRTAREIASLHGLEVIAEPALIDIDYGDWQGLRPERVRRQQPRRFSAWRERPGKARIPRGEALSSVERRVLSLIRELAERHRGRTVVLVSHDIVGKVIVASSLGASLDVVHRIAQDNASITQLEERSGTLFIASVNDTCHVERHRPGGRVDSSSASTRARASKTRS